ncbi:protein RRP5 [Trichuris trichiura]|uniref:Protein RRP5 n=1 Tax=Trichuris trichiura TaxID=36087 RepID=A0A077Z5C6_TRITR|nr:protein RRP5 [Trichuris trichiura]
MVTNEMIRLTSDDPSRQGQLWNTVPVMVRDWELEVAFAVRGKTGTLYGDGIAIWYTKDPGQPGPVFGSKDFFKGLAVFLDTYTNHPEAHNHAHPYVSAMVNNGSLHYDHDRDGTHTQLGGHEKGCTSYFRNKDYPTRILVRYVGEILSVYTDVKNEGIWDHCFTVPNVILPLNYHFGFSAATGDLSDNHDIIGVRMYEIEYHRAERENYDANKVEPNAEKVSAPRDHIDDNPPPSRLSKLRTGFLFVMALVIVAVVIVIGLNMERSFPRGGKLIVNPLHEPSSPFPPSAKNKRDRRKATNSAASEEDDFQLDEVFWAQNLTNSTCETGMLSIASIQNFIGTGFSVQMPGKVRAVLPICSISGPLATTAQSVDGIDNEGTSILDNLFKPSDLICVKITGKVQCTLPSGKIDSHWSVSSDPVLVNGHLTPGALRHRAVIAAAVRSNEEKGYLLDLGFKDVLGFMPFDVCDGESLPVGKVLICSVVDESFEEAKRVISLRPLRQLLSENDNNELQVDFPLMLVMPGLTAKATVLRTWKSGLLVHLPFNQIGYVSQSHLRHPSDNAAKHKSGSLIDVMVTFCMPQSTILGLSARDTLLRRASLDTTYPSLCKGQICYGKVCFSDKTGVTFKMEDQSYVQCSTKRLRQKYMDNIAKHYKIGSRHKMRIVGLSGLYLSYFASCRLEALKQPFSTLEEAVAGSLVKCTVAYATEEQVYVKLYKTFNGVIRKIHCSDAPNVFVNRNKFAIGSKHTVRVLAVDLEARRLLLTAKKSLVHSELPPLVECSVKIIGQTFDGYVTKFFPSGILVAFYNNLCGLLPKSALIDANISELPEQVYYIGEVIRVVVDGVNVSKNRIRLVLPNTATESKSLTTEHVKVECSPMAKQRCKPDFRVHTGEVVAVEPSGLQVRLENNFVGYVPKEHLTDSLFISDQLVSQYKPGDCLKGLVIVKVGPTPLFTMKPVIVQAVALGIAPKTFSDVDVGSLAYGYIARYNQSHGFFVDFPGHMSAICASGSLRYKFDPESVLGVSVVGRIQKIDSVRKNMSINMDIVNSLTEGLETSFKLLRQYLAELDVIRQRSDIVCLSDFHIGQICNVRVIASFERTLQCVVVNSSARAVVIAHHMERVADAYEIGSEHPAVILFVDYENQVLEVAIRGKVVRKCQRMSGKLAADIVRLKQELNAQVVLIKSNLILVLISGHGSGLMCYMPARLHYNDFGVEASKYRIGQTLKVYVEDLSDNRVLVAPVLNRLVYGKMKSDTLVLHGDTAVPLGAILKEKSISLSPLGLYNAIVTGTDGYYLKLLIAGRHQGRVFITELKDNVPDGSHLLDTFPEGTLVTVKVIHLKPFQGKSLRKIGRSKRTKIAFCTLKESKIFARNNAKSAIGYQEKFSKGELVTAVLSESRNGNWHVQVNPIWKGTVDKFHLGRCASEIRTALDNFKSGQLRHFYVTGVQPKDHHVTLSTYENCTSIVQIGIPTVAEVVSVKTTASARFNLIAGCSGVAYLTDMTDDYEKVADVLQLLKKNKFVDVCPVLCKGNKKWVVSLRESVCCNDKALVKDPVISSTSALCPGTVCRGFIRDVTSTQLHVALGYNIFGFVTLERTSVYRTESLSKAFQPGSLVTVAVMQTSGVGLKSLDVEKNSMIPLSMLRIDTGVDDQLPESFRCKQMHNEDQCQDAYEQLAENCSWFSVSHSCSHKRMRRVSLLGEPNSPDDGRNTGMQEGSADCVTTGATAQQDMLHSRERENVSGNDVLEEQQILQRELMLLDPDKGLQSTQDFDRALFASPNSSALWTRYMAYFLELNDVDKARAVGRKALKTILAKNETERFNIWLALLNLENEFGSQDSMDKIVAEALEVNDHFLLYSHLLKIYQKSHKVQQGDLLVTELLNKFRSEYECWIMACQYYMMTGRTELARNTMERSFKSMPKSVHIDLTSRFAQMEFKCSGDPDRGCTLFEKILDEKPKRYDIWHVYIDLNAKYRSMEEARLIIERVISLKMSAHKMRSFYKKWLELETRYGSKNDVEKVKLKAAHFVNHASLAEWKRSP